MSTRLRWSLIAIILLTWGLRLYHLLAQSLWYDEAVTADVAQMGLDRLTRWTADDIQPPLYYYLQAGWTRLAGTGEWALRFPSVAFGLVSIALAYGLSRRLFGKGGLWGTVATLLGTLFMALSPLHLYYSQEARMYSLLTALGLAMAMLLTDWLHKPLTLVQRRDRWVGFIGLSIVAVYTHYYAFFLILAFALYFLLVWSRHRPRAILYEAVGAVASLFIAYLPWFSIIADRYRLDSSYWQGTLKLDEALRHTIISFSLGETVLEATATRLSAGFVLLLLLSLVILTWKGAAMKLEPQPTPPARRRGRRRQHAAPVKKARPGFQIPFNVLFLLCYLVVPVLGILIFSYRNPKFNPRYLMLASPAFLLMLAAGIARLGWGFPRVTATSRLIFLAPAGVALTFVIGTFIVADANLYFDPAFTKPDFRSAVRYVEANRSNDEAVVLISGHMSPAWDYYAPESERVRLPDIDVLDTSSVLHFSAADDLNVALEGKQGVWLVLWQDEVVDPLGMVDALLSRASDIEPEETRFWHVVVRHYPNIHLPISGEPPMTETIGVNFGGMVELVGFHQDGEGAITFYWRALQPLVEDLKMTLSLTDDDGFLWGRAEDRRLAGYLYPTIRWEVGPMIPGRYASLPADPATPPGTYRLRLGVYNARDGRALDVMDEAGAAQATWTEVGPITLSTPATVTDVNTLLMTNRSGESLADGIELLGFSAQPDEGQPGDPISLDLWFRANRQIADDMTLWFRWLGPDGEGVASENRLPLAEFPTSAWTTGDIWRGQYTAPIWIGATAGEWQLQVAMTPYSEEEPAPWLDLWPVQVVETERAFEVPAMQRVSGAVFQDGPTLVGVDLSAESLQLGHTLAVTVTWQANGPTDRPYTAFVHLLDDEGKLASGRDAAPGGETRPTTGWVPDEVLSHRFELSLPNDAHTGDYALEIGLYDASRAGLPRLKALPTDGEQPSDRVLLGTVRVEAQR